MRAPARVFISHCSEDAQIASSAYAALRERATALSLTSPSMLGERHDADSTTEHDHDWLRQPVMQAIDEASHFIALLSPAALRSRKVIAEVQYAYACALTQRMLQLIPVVVEPLEPSALSVWFGEAPIRSAITTHPGNAHTAIGDVLGDVSQHAAIPGWPLATEDSHRAPLAPGHSDPREPRSMDLALDWYRRGIARMEEGGHQDAEEALRQARALATYAGVGPLLANIVNVLGDLYARRGDLTAALSSYREAIALYAVSGDLPGQGRAHSNAASALTALARPDEARAQLIYALTCKAPFGRSAEPWVTLGLLRDLERAQGNQGAAARAHEQAMMQYVSYRRAGGNNSTMGGTLCKSVVDAITHQTMAALAPRLAALAMEPMCQDVICALIGALNAVLEGSRDPALAHDQALRCEDAAELHLVIKALR